jgi:hypothetical protein
VHGSIPKTNLNCWIFRAYPRSRFVTEISCRRLKNS